MSTEQLRASVAALRSRWRALERDWQSVVVAALRSRWRALERDWQSVVVAAIVVGTTVTLEVRIPW